MSKLLYRGTSSYGFSSGMAYRMLALAAIVWLITIFGRNPPVISVLIGIAALFFLTYGNDDIWVYSDRIVIGDISIWRLITKSKGKTYFLKDVKLCSYSYGRLPYGTSSSADSLADRLFPSNEEDDDIELELTNGEIVIIPCELENDKKDKIIRAVNSIVLQQPAGSDVKS